MRPVVAASRISSEVIRKPEITKKTSTPTNPPEKVSNPEWATMTSSTASARRPWMSGRKWRPWEVASLGTAPGTSQGKGRSIAALNRRYGAAPIDSPACPGGTRNTDAAVVTAPSGPSSP